MRIGSAADAVPWPHRASPRVIRACGRSRGKDDDTGVRASLLTIREKGARK